VSSKRALLGNLRSCEIGKAVEPERCFYPMAKVSNTCKPAPKCFSVDRQNDKRAPGTQDCLGAMTLQKSGRAAYYSPSVKQPSTGKCQLKSKRVDRRSQNRSRCRSTHLARSPSLPSQPKRLWSPKEGDYCCTKDAVFFCLSSRTKQVFFRGRESFFAIVIEFWRRSRRADGKKGDVLQAL
jgi:hypothetical protein